jgi:hypothetical protein
VDEVTALTLTKVWEEGLGPVYRAEKIHVNLTPQPSFTEPANRFWVKNACTVDKGINMSEALHGLLEKILP